MLASILNPGPIVELRCAAWEPPGGGGGGEAGIGRAREKAEGGVRLGA